MAGVRVGDPAARKHPHRPEKHPCIHEEHEDNRTSAQMGIIHRHPSRRTPTLAGNPGDFKRLPFHLAKQAEVPIIPIGISSLYQLKRKGSWFIRPRPVSIKFGEPVDRDTIQALSVEELRFHIRSKIQDLVE